MPQFLVTSPDGQKYNVTAPEGATMQDALERVKQQHTAAPSQPAKPVEPQGPKQATDIPPGQKEAGPMGQPMRFGGSTTIASTIPQGPTWEQAQQKLKDLQAKGVSQDDPQFKQALKERALGLQRLSSGGMEMMGAGMAPARVAEGAIPLAQQAAKVIPAITGKDALAASKGLVTDTMEHIGSAISDAQKPIGAAKALEDVKAARPNATILDIKAPSAEMDGKLAQARAGAQQAARAAQTAADKLTAVKTKLATVDKYATNKSSSQVRAARRDLTVAQREFDAASQAKEEATTALADVSNAAKELRKSDLAASKSGASGQSKSERQIAKEAQAAKGTVQRLEQFRAELDSVSNTPRALVSKARALGAFLKQQGRFNEAQYRTYLGQVNEVEKKFGQTQQARDALKAVLKEGAKAAGIGAGIGIGDAALSRSGF